MIKTILHQIWNERRQNGWLFLELVAVSIFLWLAIDPLFVLISHECIPKGYNSDNVYCLEFMPTDIAYEDDADVVCENDFNSAVNIMRSLPEVAAYSVAFSNNVPNSMSNNCPQYTIDSTMTADGKSRSMHITTYETYDYSGSDYFATMQIRDVHTGEVMKKSGEHGAYISENLALDAFGTTDVIGRKMSIPDNNNETVTVVGLFSTVQTLRYIEPMYLIIRVCDRSEICNYMPKSYIFENFKIFVRLRQGTDVDGFMKRFEKEVAPKLNFKYKRFEMLNAIDKYGEKAPKMFGMYNKYRMQLILSGFALFCAFLGIISTYWIRSQARRSDVGLLRSMGATSGRVLWQFILEGWLLVTASFLLTLPLLLHKVHSMGFATPLAKYASMMWEELMLAGDAAYLHNQPVTHFVIVTLLAYLFVLAVAAIGIIIPTKRIIRMQPAEALREE